MRALLTITSLAILAAAATADDRVSLPADYRETFTEYLALDRTQNPDQFIRLYANDVAMRGVDPSGALQNGSVIVGEVYSVAKDKDGDVKTSALDRRIVDQLLLLAVMEKRAGFGETSTSLFSTGDWDFAAFKPDGSAAAKNLDECRACHAPLTRTDFVFSTEHLPQPHND